MPETFERWSKTAHNGPLVRFDPTDPAEGRLRTLVGNLQDLARPHLAYVGTDDRWFHPNATRLLEEARRSGAPLTVEYVEGDHMRSLVPAYARILERLAEVPA